MLEQNQFFTLPSGKIVNLSDILEITTPSSSDKLRPFGSYQYRNQPAFHLADGEYQLLAKAVKQYGEFEAKIKKGAFILGQEITTTTFMNFILCELFKKISCDCNYSPSPPDNNQADHLHDTEPIEPVKPNL